MDSTSIIESLNSLLTKVFLSLETKIFKVLDEITYISTDILKKEPLKNIKMENDKESFIILISSLILFITISFLISKFFNIYNSEKQENTIIYFLKIIVCAIISSMSFYIISEILKINQLFTDVIKDIGKNITNEEISFESLRIVIKDIEKYMTEDFVSLDGLIKGVVSFGMITLLINLSIRYVTIIFLIFVVPIVFMFAANTSTELIFKSWTKLFATQLLTQELIYIILIIPLSFKAKQEDMFKIVLVGSIYLLYRINIFADKIFENIGNKIIKRE